MIERRDKPRYDFAAPIELVDLYSGKQIVSLTLNISSEACSVATTTPFETGRAVELTIRQDGEVFTTSGRVVRVVPRELMVISFDYSEDGEEIAVRFGERRLFCWL